MRGEERIKKRTVHSKHKECRMVRVLTSLISDLEDLGPFFFFWLGIFFIPYMLVPPAGW